MDFAIDPKLLIPRDEAAKLVPLLVNYTECPVTDRMGLWEKLNDFQQKAKKGQEVVVADRDFTDPSKTRYIRARISSVTRDWRNEDGPVIRVKAGNVSWRVDGLMQFHPTAH